MVTSDFKPEVEIWPFRACTMHPANCDVIFGNWVMTSLLFYGSQCMYTIIKITSNPVYRYRFVESLLFG